MNSGCKGIPSCIESSTAWKQSIALGFCKKLSAFMPCGFFPSCKAFSSSSFHHSSQYPTGTKEWAVFLKSPKLTRMSPKKRNSFTWGFIFSASSKLFTFTTESLFNNTIGPSIESQGNIPALFPGLSTFSCVPTAINPSRRCIAAGCTAFAIIPVFLPLPYLSLKPPGFMG